TSPRRAAVRTCCSRRTSGCRSLPSMFTGIVRELGRVVAFDGDRLLVEAPQTTAELGDSVAIDGVCLTVVSHDGGQLAFDVVGETLGRSTLGTLAAGDPVNVEPALRAGSRSADTWCRGTSTVSAASAAAPGF